MSATTQTAHARTTAKPAQATPAATDQKASVEQREKAILDQITKNPVYQFLFEGSDPKEQRIEKVKAFLLAGLREGTATEQEMDSRRAALTDFNAFVQAMSRRLGAQQARQITDKASADFERILNETAADVQDFETELEPLGKLAELFNKYGVEGNLIEKINTAKEQKRHREASLGVWQEQHRLRVAAAERPVDDLNKAIREDEQRLRSKWLWGRAVIEARLVNAKNDLATKREELQAVRDETPPASNGEGAIEVDEGILELQNIGGPKFKQAVSTLRDHTEQTLAKISNNFDEAVTGLTNTRTAFTEMDRNCSDAEMALSILEAAVREAETESRTIAAEIMKHAQEATGPQAELDRLERSRRSSSILTYTASLTTYVKEMGLAVGSLRGGKAVIENILRMNSLALESANTHRVTGIANTASAVTIIIGSIIEACNRAASRALADGLSRVRQMAVDATGQFEQGTYETLQMQNEQLTDFIDHVKDLRVRTTDITANSVELLKEQYDLMRKMRLESDKLADATTEAQQTSFNARAGVLETPQPDQKPEAASNAFTLRVPETH